METIVASHVQANQSSQADTPTADMEELCKAVVIGAGGAATVVLTPALIVAIGFTSGGIAAGSIAAELMAYFAVANGGGVVAGGLVAFLQSVGAGGLSWTSFAALFGAGGTLAGLLSDFCNQTRTH